jgi:hypothetical protein
MYKGENLLINKEQNHGGNLMHDTADQGNEFYKLDDQDSTLEVIIRILKFLSSNRRSEDYYNYFHFPLNTIIHDGFPISIFKQIQILLKLNELGCICILIDSGKLYISLTDIPL